MSKVSKEEQAALLANFQAQLPPAVWEQISKDKTQMQRLLDIAANAEPPKKPSWLVRQAKKVWNATKTALIGAGLFTGIKYAADQAGYGEYVGLKLTADQKLSGDINSARNENRNGPDKDAILKEALADSGITVSESVDKTIAGLNKEQKEKFATVLRAELEQRGIAPALKEPDVAESLKHGFASHALLIGGLNLGMGMLNPNCAEDARLAEDQQIFQMMHAPARAAQVTQAGYMPEQFTPPAALPNQRQQSSGLFANH